MYERELSDTEIERLIAGNGIDGHPEDGADGALPLVELIGELRSQVSASPVLTPGPALAELLGLVPLPAPTHVQRAQRRTIVQKAAAAISAGITTTAGKIIIASAVGATTLAGAHATDVVDVPGLSNRPDRAAVADEKGSSDDAGGHGQEISEFVKETDLEGCERGQAISALASTDSTEHRQNPPEDNSPCDGGDPQSGNDDAKPGPDGPQSPDSSQRPPEAGQPEDPGKPAEPGKSADAGSMGES